jgi:hypothetical protein
MHLPCFPRSLPPLDSPQLRCRRLPARPASGAPRAVLQPRRRQAHHRHRQVQHRRRAYSLPSMTSHRSGRRRLIHLRRHASRLAIGVERDGERRLVVDHAIDRPRGLDSLASQYQMIYSSSDPCRVGFLIVYIELYVLNKSIVDTTEDVQRRFASSLMMEAASSRGVDGFDAAVTMQHKNTGEDGGNGPPPRLPPPPHAPAARGHSGENIGSDSDSGGGGRRGGWDGGRMEEEVAL